MHSCEEKRAVKRRNPEQYQQSPPRYAPSPKHPRKRVYIIRGDEWAGWCDCGTLLIGCTHFGTLEFRKSPKVPKKVPVTGASVWCLLPCLLFCKIRSGRGPRS